VFDPAADFESAGEGALREGELAIGKVRLAPRLCRVGFTPGVAAVGVGGEIERLPRRLDRLRRIGPGQPDARQRDQQLDSKKAVAAGRGVRCP
jgi:hypothetical protein